MNLETSSKYRVIAGIDCLRPNLHEALPLFMTVRLFLSRTLLVASCLRLTSYRSLQSKAWTLVGNKRQARTAKHAGTMCFISRNEQKSRFLAMLRPLKNPYRWFLQMACQLTKSFRARNPKLCHPGERRDPDLQLRHTRKVWAPTFVGVTELKSFLGIKGFNPPLDHPARRGRRD
jgi:hypothetical protein